ncbi:hypothetical protein CSIM01_01210 [Colletotrichum simmondsii]|uniref:Uncharacterized protein n=1 Tax=Colletotrichum simmondsii TaxID=703756 RepID=A0A135TA75_9PEZI|nr:hypothetical protein CSIM01_01210 [Colletotrichum simmondsii]
MNNPSEVSTILESDFHVPALDFTGVTYAFDISSATTSSTDARDFDTIEWNSLNGHRMFFCSSPSTGNNLLPTHRPEVIDPQTSNRSSFLGVPKSEAQPCEVIRAFQAFDLSISGGLDDQSAIFSHSAFTDALENPRSKSNNEDENTAGTLNRTAKASISPVPNKRRRFDTSSDGLSTPGECSYCKSVCGDAKRLRFVSLNRLRYSHNNLWV